MSTRPAPPELTLVPARWWQAVDFLRMNLAVVREVDPLAERIASRPWAPSSLLEYAFMLRAFLISDPCFVFASGERAGLAWTSRRRAIVLVVSIGMLPRFQKRGFGTRIIGLIEDRAREHGCIALAAVIAATNQPVHRLIAACGARPLGLGTAPLLLPADRPLQAPPSDVQARPARRAEAAAAWKRWRLHEVSHVAGEWGVEVAAQLLGPPPRGQPLILQRGEEQVGFALARRRGRQVELTLFPAAEMWDGPSTAGLIAALAERTGSPVRRLTLTQTHADRLAASAPFDFERRPEEERQFVFKPLAGQGGGRP